MRPIEVSLIVLLVIFALLSFAGAKRLVKQALLVVCLITLGAHLLIEGAHWQMLPAYIAAAFAAIRTPTGSTNRDKRFPRIEAGLVLVLCAICVAFSVALPMFSLPQPTGQFALGTRVLFLEDGSRHEPSLSDPSAKRRLVAQIWYPAEPSNNKLAIYRGTRESDPLSSYESVIRTNSRLDAPVKATTTPFPVLLFSHGLGGRRTALTYLAEDMASHGYVVVSIDYPYIASRVEWSDGHVIRGTRKLLVEDPESSNAATVEAEWNKEVELWGADQIFVLNTLQQESKNPQSVWYQKINTDLVGAIGHSFGGSAALYVSGIEPRIRSAINIDGWTFGGIRNRTSDKPVMFINGDLDTIRLDDPSLSRPPNNVTEQLAQLDFSAIKQSLKQYGGYMLNMTETNHLDFTDKALITSVPRLRRRAELGPIKPAEIHAIVRSYVLAFFDKTMMKKESTLLDPQTKPPFPEVTFQRWLPADSATSGNTVSPTVEQSH